MTRVSCEICRRTHEGPSCLTVLRERIDAFNSRLADEVNDFAEGLAASCLYPYLRRKGYSFMAGNGTFIVCDSLGRILPDEELPSWLLELLNAEVGCHVDAVGLQVPDYPAKEVS